MVQKLDVGRASLSLAEPQKLEDARASPTSTSQRRRRSSKSPCCRGRAPPLAPTGAGSAATTAGRVVFKVTADTIPPIDFADPKVKTLQDKIAEAMTDDIVNQYVAQLQRQLGVVINENALATAEGS